MNIEELKRSAARDAADPNYAANLENARIAYENVDVSRTRYKGELLRIGTQCGITDHEALGKFIKIVAKRIDSAYELGKSDGGTNIEDLKKAAYGAACGTMAAYDVWEDTKTDAARSNYEAAKTASEILYAAAYQQVREQTIEELKGDMKICNASGHSEFMDDLAAKRSAHDTRVAARDAYVKEKGK